MLWAVLAVLVIAAIVGGTVVALRGRRDTDATSGAGRRNDGHDRSP